jgi:hypothetical protein
MTSPLGSPRFQIRFSGVTGSPSAFAGFSLNIISSSRLLKPCERIAADHCRASLVLSRVFSPYLASCVPYLASCVKPELMCYCLSSVIVTSGTSLPGDRIEIDCLVPRVVSVKLAVNAAPWAIACTWRPLPEERP